MIGSCRILITVLALLFVAFEGEAACMRGRLKSSITTDDSGIYEPIFVLFIDLKHISLIYRFKFCRRLL